MVKKLQTIPKHINYDKNKTKTLDAQNQKFPHETINTPEPVLLQPRIYLGFRSRKF